MVVLTFEYTSINLNEALSPSISVYNQGNSVQESGTMTHLGSGKYGYSYTSSTAGSYFGRVTAEGRTSVTPIQLITTTAVAADTITAVNTTYLHVKWRLGDMEPSIGSGSANVVSQAISGANEEVKELTGGKTAGQHSSDVVTYAVADLAAAEVIDTFLARDDLTVSNQRESMARNLRERAYRKIQSVGYTFAYKMSNQ